MSKLIKVINEHILKCMFVMYVMIKSIKYILLLTVTFVAIYYVLN